MTLADLVESFPRLALDAGETLLPSELADVSYLFVDDGLIVLRTALPDSTRRTITCHAGSGTLVLPPRGTRPLFDDPAVVGAMRAVLRDPGRVPLFSTLVDGATDWAGSVSGADPALVGRDWWAEDPFARLGPQHRLLVPAGVLCPRPLPPGPCHQRHAGAPWPWGTFL